MGQEIANCQKGSSQENHIDFFSFLDDRLFYVEIARSNRSIWNSLVKSLIKKSSIQTVFFIVWVCVGTSRKWSTMLMKNDWSGQKKPFQNPLMTQSLRKITYMGFPVKDILGKICSSSLLGQFLYWIIPLTNPSKGIYIFHF